MRMWRTALVVLIAFALQAQSVRKSAISRKSAVSGKAVVKAASAGEDWLVWGGKNRDFQVSSAALADSWPASGPKKLWSRALGDGYSAIAEEHGVLYTAFRRGSHDVVTALVAATGKTIWE